MNCWTDRAIFDLARNQIETKTHEARKTMDEVRERLNVLDDLERGDTTVEQTIRRLEEAGQGAAEKSHVKYGRQWWIKPLAWGGIVSIAGVLLGIQGGWLWLGAAPLLLVGMLMVTLAVAAINAPYVHLRANLGKRKAVVLSFPIPLSLIAKLMKRFGPNIPQLDGTALDELIMSLKGMNQPLTIDVDRGAGGERVHLSFG
jgi:hypothetical protein